MAKTIVEIDVQDLIQKVSRIDEAILGDGGLKSRLAKVESDVGDIKLLVAGGLDPETGKPVTGIAQTLNQHLKMHNTVNRTVKATLVAMGSTIVTLVAAMWNQLMTFIKQLLVKL
jgi:hypothetical protein